MADLARTKTRLDQPRERRRRLPRYDADAFGRGAERVASFLGTGNFLVLMTIFVVVWIGLNVAWVRLRWDPYPFILLNLMFSTQASYAAPLILLAQNRQTDRDRIALEEDRQRAQAAKADTEYLARELAALRLALSETVTREYLRSELSRLVDEVRTPEPPASTDADVDSRRVGETPRVPPRPTRDRTTRRR